MAILELYLASRSKVNHGLIITDDRVLLLEYVIILVAIYAICAQLSRRDIWFVLIGAIATDTFAYFIGSSMHGLFFQKRPFPKTSPKKSWEGIIGGAFGCIMVLTGILLVTEDPLDIGTLAFVFLCPIFSIIGDFLASFCKRLLGVKDSNECIMEGNLTALKFCEKFMSGHGGYLDRVDSVAMAVCLMFFIRITET